LLIAPHKLRWFFVFKVVVTVTVSVAVVIAMTHKAGGTGDIWSQDYRVPASEKNWVIMASLMSQSSGWATMATKFVSRAHPGSTRTDLACPVSLISPVI
jgi:NCS1 family nucleobase:cation symporter-1